VKFFEGEEKVVITTATQQNRKNLENS